MMDTQAIRTVGAVFSVLREGARIHRRVTMVDKDYVVMQVISGPCDGRTVILENWEVPAYLSEARFTGRIDK